MPINSKKKGARAELELAHELSHLFGLKARRGQQYSGSPESPDVVFHPEIQIECKRTERLNLNKAVEQAIDDASEHQVPVVMSRMNRKPWLVTLKLEDLKRLSKIIVSLD